MSSLLTLHYIKNISQCMYALVHLHLLLQMWFYQAVLGSRFLPSDDLDAYCIKTISPGEKFLCASIHFLVVTKDPKHWTLCWSHNAVFKSLMKENLTLGCHHNSHLPLRAGYYGCFQLSTCWKLTNSKSPRQERGFGFFVQRLVYH